MMGGLVYPGCGSRKTIMLLLEVLNVSPTSASLKQGCRVLLLRGGVKRKHLSPRSGGILGTWAGRATLGV
jgi:hypothetical protein